QTCIAPDYVLVDASIKERFVTALTRYIKASYGENMESSTDFARMVSNAHYNGLRTMLEGEDILFGGETNDMDNYLSPTLVNEPSLDSKLMKGEIFGPILPIISYTDETQIHTYITNYEKPLSTYVFSKRRSFQKKIIDRYSFGGGAINDTTVHYVNKNLPFGGVGASGIGAYHGKSSFDVFTHQKPVIKRGNWMDAPLRYPPYKLPVAIAKKIKHLF
ncbi:MAG: aldehyde dehydrogenase family protein, partial [Bacteroidota bacterium]